MKRQTRSGFLWIPNALFDLYIKTLQPSSILVYMALAKKADNETQQCYPSYETISEMTGLSRSAVATGIQELREKNLIHWQNLPGKQGRRNCYTLLDIVQNLDSTQGVQSEITALESSPLDENYTQITRLSNDNYRNLVLSPTEDPPRKTKPKPTREQVAAYIQQQSYSVNPDSFFDYYEANGWKVGKNPMKDWKAAVRYWDRNGMNGGGGKSNGNGFKSFAQQQQEARESAFARARAARQRSQQPGDQNPPNI